MRTFADRSAAGDALARELQTVLTDLEDPLVLALPRGGLPVAVPVAQALNAELDLLLVRKLGLPWHPELAMGAIASGDIRVLNDDVVAHSGVSTAQLAQVEKTERKELERRSVAYRGDRPPPEIKGRTVILVDDGIATGATMQAAVAAVRSQHPATLIVAVPVGAPDTLARLRTQADRVIAVLEPENLSAIGQWYRHFDQTSDAEVKALLQAAWHPEHPSR